MVTVFLSRKSIGNLMKHYKEMRDQIPEKDISSLRPDVRLEFTDTAVVGTYEKVGESIRLTSKIRLYPDKTNGEKEVVIPAASVKGMTINNAFMSGETPFEGIEAGKKGVIFRIALAAGCVLFPYIYDLLPQYAEEDEPCGILISNEDFPTARIVRGKDRPDLTATKVNIKTGKLEMVTGRFYKDEMVHDDKHPEDFCPDDENVAGISRTYLDRETGKEVSVPLTKEEYRSIANTKRLRNLGQRLCEEYGISVSSGDENFQDTIGMDEQYGDFVQVAMNTESISKFVDFNDPKSNASVPIPGRIVFDLSDAPYTAVLSADGAEKTFAVYKRRFVKMLSEKLCEVSFSTESGLAFPQKCGMTFKGSSTYAEVAVSLLFAVFRAIGVMNEDHFLSRHNVSGKDGYCVVLKTNGMDTLIQSMRYRLRPTMLCVFQNGEEKLFRPYMDEFKDELKERIQRDWMSVQALEAAAEDGDADCAEMLISYYSFGQAADLQKAEYWMEKFAETGSREGILNAGFSFLEGETVKRNLAKASFWLEKAVNQGEEDFRELFEKVSSMAKTERKALEGDGPAMAEFAQFLIEMKNFAARSEGYSYAEKSAALACPDGIYIKAFCAEQGLGTQKDTEYAKRLYLQAAEIGNAPAMFRLGLMQTEGQEGTNSMQDYAMAERAANLGYVPAMKWLGKRYETGDGLPKDPQLAAQWYAKALELTPEDEDLEFDLFMLRMELDNP